MATESCPKCGEKAISSTGHCVFCGAVVIAPKTAPAGKAYEQALRMYQWISGSFVVLGIFYIGLGVVGSIMLKSPMLGFFSAGLLSVVHGGMLYANNDWVRSVTKVVCGLRLFVFILIFFTVIPYFLHLGIVGILFSAFFLIDIISLIQMIRIIDEVEFA